jgi:SAM-dependent methyltransferase
VPDLRIASDPYIDPEKDRAKGLRVAARSEEIDFAGLVDYYYSITDVVPPHHARQYKRGLMAGVARAQSSLSSWEEASGSDYLPCESLLDIGCGTAPLLVAAAPRYKRLVGVDIAFRWLTVGNKRLKENGVDAVLICACAEALPFPDGTAFDRVVLDSTIEHVADQRRALAECNRVLRPSGKLFVSTPNQYSLGPDPHIGLWAGGLWPQSWIKAYALRQGAIPPSRRLLWKQSLARLIEETGFTAPTLLLPRISREQRNCFGTRTRWLIDLYQLAQTLPLSRQFLFLIGPLLHAVAAKPEAAAQP